MVAQTRTEDVAVVGVQAARVGVGDYLADVVVGKQRHDALRRVAAVLRLGRCGAGGERGNHAVDVRTDAILQLGIRVRAVELRLGCGQLLLQAAHLTVALHHLLSGLLR